jgi:hypothetical protein
MKLRLSWTAEWFGMVTLTGGAGEGALEPGGGVGGGGGAWLSGMMR